MSGAVAARVNDFTAAQATRSAVPASLVERNAVCAVVGATNFSQSSATCLEVRVTSEANATAAGDCCGSGCCSSDGSSDRLGL